MASPFSEFAPPREAEVAATLSDDGVHVAFDRRIAIRGPMVGGKDRGTILRAMVDGHNKFIDATEEDDRVLADRFKARNPHPPSKGQLPLLIGQFEEVGDYLNGGMQGKVYDNRAKGHGRMRRRSRPSHRLCASIKKIKRPNSALAPR